MDPPDSAFPDLGYKSMLLDSAFNAETWVWTQVLLLASLTLCWLSYLPALVDAYFIVAIIVCALGREPRALQMPNQDSYHRPTLGSVHFSWLELHKIALKRSPPLPKVLTSKIIFLCFYLLLHFAQWFWETAQKITMLHLLNWPCRALPLVHASSPREEKKRVCQAHAENIIPKPTRICKNLSLP